MENQDKITEELKKLTASSTDELKTALNEATKDELVNLTLTLHKILNLVNESLANNQKIIADQQKTINDSRDMVKTMVRMNNDKITIDFKSYIAATAPGMDLESTINKIEHTITLTLTKRSVQ